MRDVTIKRGECIVHVDGEDKPCPVCHALIASGMEHRCVLVADGDRDRAALVHAMLPARRQRHEVTE